MMYINEKEKAIKLRKEGKTYSEILKDIPVAKSTLSEWFRDVKLSKTEIQKLTEKKLAGARRGGEAKRSQRIERVKEIHQKAIRDITHISKRELWLIGIALYWAEGSKEKDYCPGSGLKFSNSDPNMVRVFLRWIFEICKISKKDVIIEIYIHENSKNSIGEVKSYWSGITGFDVEELNRVYYKKNKIIKKRRNIGGLYYGQIRVKVRSSSNLVRQIAGWSEAIFLSV